MDVGEAAMLRHRIFHLPFDCVRSVCSVVSFYLQHKYPISFGYPVIHSQKESKNEWNIKNKNEREKEEKNRQEKKSRKKILISFVTELSIFQLHELQLRHIHSSFAFRIRFFFFLLLSLGLDFSLSLSFFYLFSLLLRPIHFIQFISSFLYKMFINSPLDCAIR